MNDNTRVTITLNEADFSIVLHFSFPLEPDKRHLVSTRPISLFGIFERAYQLAENDPQGELPQLMDFLTWLARHMCIQTAQEIEDVGKQVALRDDMKRFVSLCSPPFVPDEEAFRLFVNIIREEAENALRNVEQADLHPTVKDAVQRQLEFLLEHSEQPVNPLQVVAIWHVWEIFMHVTADVMLAAAFRSVPSEVLETAARLVQLESAYVAALAEVRQLPLKDEQGRKFAERLREELNRQQRLDRKPGGTGRKREHEVVESELISDEEPPPLELVPDPNTPDPAEVVADADAVERMLAQFGERTAQLLRLELQGYSLSEAARQLGIAPATARKLKERAKKKIEKYLKNRL